MSAPVTYSFLDTQASITGPGAAFNIGSSAGIAEEGITVEDTENIGGLTVGADGTAMHSLYADKSGKVTVRLLKTSPVNAQLEAAAAFQRTSAANYGQNTLTITNTVSGDTITCQLVGFAKRPTVTYAKEGGMMEWEFNCGIIDRGLGAGVAA